MEICADEHTYRAVLTPGELKKLSEINHKGKRIEYAATRFLKQLLFGNNEITYDKSGGPQINNKGHISISHTSKMVAIGVCQDFQLGIDIELIRDKSVTLSPRFIHEDETQWFDPANKKDMSSLWSLKECLYKLSDRNQLLFQKDIRVYKENDQLLGSVLKKEGVFEYTLIIHEYQDILITCNTSSGKKIS